MHRPPRPSRAGWLLVAAAGLVGCAATASLPRGPSDLGLPAAVYAVLATAGAALVLLAARVPGTSPGDPVVRAVGVLGASVVVYPSLLALASADVGGAATAVLAAAWHVLPLTLVQVLPLLAGARAVGRSHRRWEVGLVVVSVLGVLLTGLGLYAAPVLLAVSTVLWFGSFAVGPTVAWTSVRGTAGEARRRAVVAGIAAVAPVAVITWCVALGLLGTGRSEAWTVSALMLGFAVGTLSCGTLTLLALAPPGAGPLRPRVVAGALDVLLASLVAVVVSVVVSLGALSSSRTQLSPEWATAVGAAVALGVVLPWRRLHLWTRRVVDPVAELHHELAVLGRVEEGGHRRRALDVLRRVIEDPGLTLAYPDLGSGSDRGPGPSVVAHDDEVVLARSATGVPTVVARAGERRTSRLRALGDCSDVLHPALLEARVEQESRRADEAARHEREQLSRDLHDGLQSRLLGLALHLQLGSRRLADPAASLLTDEAVATLRSMVDDVRALGGRGAPCLLTREGLAPALEHLLAPVGSLVRLDLPTARFDARAEATAYFVVAEAVANALKHARPGRIDVRVSLVDARRVAVTVADDGPGGADPRLGTGLRGLAERVSSTGGVLLVRDRGPGTEVEAVLPCGS